MLKTVHLWLEQRIKAPCAYAGQDLASPTRCNRSYPGSQTYSDELVLEKQANLEGLPAVVLPPVR